MAYTQTHYCFFPFLFIQLDSLFCLDAELIGWLATDQHPDIQTGEDDKSRHCSYIAYAFIVMYSS